MNIRFRKPKIKIKSFFRIVTAALISSVLISTVLISLPYTERVYDKVRYDVTLAPKIWKEQYTLELNVKPADFDRKAKKVSETKAILERRLRQYGVQEINFREERSNVRDVAILVLTVETDKDKESVERLISQRNYLRFVLRKEGVNFEDEENPFAQYDPANYVKTPFSLHYFRQIYITELQATGGEKTTFSIYKPWEYKANDFYEYFDKYAGQYAGIEIDGFVSPIIVPITASSVTGGITARAPFALGVSGTKNDIKILNILNNTGVIPVKYTLKEQKSINIKEFEFDYIKTILVISILTTIIYIANYLFTKNGSLISFFAYGLTATTVIAGMKMLSVPIQPITMLYTALTLTILLPILSNSKAVSITIALLGLLLSFTGIGYILDIGRNLFYILTTFVVLQYTLTYLTNLTKSISNDD